MINPFTHRKILKKGKPGRARITAFAMPVRGSATQNIPMTLEVHVEGLSPYEVEDQWMVSRKDTLGFGIEVPVKVDPDKPDRVAIDWESARAERAGEKEARRAGLAAQPPVGSPPRPGAAAGGGAIRDPLAGGGVPLASTSTTASIDARNDPELRAKLEQALGRKLEPGTQESLDVSGDPALAAKLMAIVQQHSAQKAQHALSGTPGDRRAAATRSTASSDSRSCARAVP